MARSLKQQESEARNHLRLGYLMGCDDDAAIDYACRMMGEASRALIVRVHARDFSIAGPV